MKPLCRTLTTTVSAVIMIGFSSIAHAEDDAPQYIGVKSCGMCHKSDSKGNQLAQWESSRHSKAFETLATDKALKIGEEVGLDVPPQQSADCLRCHVTGHGEKEELFAASFKPEQGVQCESCHGAGSKYKSIKVMKDREASIAAGLVIPNEATCTKCHNEDSPTFESFDFEKMWALIMHPNPQKASN